MTTRELALGPTRLTCQAPHPLAARNPGRFGGRPHNADAGVTIPFRAHPLAPGETLDGYTLIIAVRCRHTDCRATTLWVVERGPYPEAS